MPGDPSPFPRVAHLVSLKNLGGVERYFSRFFLSFGKDLDLDIFLQTEKIHPFIAQDFIAHGHRLHSIKGPGKLKLPEAFGIRQRYFKSLIDNTSPQAIIVWNKLRGNPMPPGTGVPVFHYEHGTSWVAKRDASTDKYLQRLNGVIAVSNAAKRMLQIRWGLRESTPVLTLHNAIELPDRASEHPEGRFRLGFAGRLKGLKAPMVALETFRVVHSHFPNAEFWIAGQGLLEPVLREWVRLWGLQDSVRFCGLMDDMSSFYTSLDAFICPSWREPFGLVAQEAIAHGVPTVVSNVDGLPEALLDASHGAVLEPTRPKQMLAKYGEACVEGPSEVYSPRSDSLVAARVLDPEEAAQQLLYWANSPELRRRMGLQARERLASEQSLQRYGDQLMNFIQSNL